MKNESHQAYVSLLNASARVRLSIKEVFFLDAFDRKLSDYIREYILWFQATQRDRMNQYRSQAGYPASINSIQELVTQLQYLAKSETTPLLIFQKELLKSKSEMLAGLKKCLIETNETLALETQPQVLVTPVDNTLTVKKDSQSKKTVVASQAPASKRNRTEGMILDFIRESRSVRVKEVISQFSAISQRTIKRSLKGLSDAGLVSKNFDGATVLYSAR